MLARFGRDAHRPRFPEIAAMSAPLCFVAMPSGRRQGAGDVAIDFDAVYAELIEPAIALAGMKPLRSADEPAATIDAAAFEWLLLCEYAVADLTLATPNDFYRLGVRAALRPTRTVAVFARSGRPIRFDAEALLALPYTLLPDGHPAKAEEERGAIAARLQQAIHAQPAHGVFQLTEDFRDVQRLKTDVFRERVAYSEQIKARLAAARRMGADAVREVATSLDRPIAVTEAGIVIDLLLSYRAVSAWNDMIALVPQMAPPLAASVMVQEQLAFALNRAGHDQEAEALLEGLIARRGASSETCSLLGRVYKDRWQAAVEAGDPERARDLIDKAIGAYRRGFESDWRDAYPGINVVTLMELREPPDPQREALLPVVRYAVERRIAAGKPDYWDYASRLELAVLGRDEAAARQTLADALGAVREPWEPESTARNLLLIREARERRGEPTRWAAEIEAALKARATR